MSGAETFRAEASGACGAAALQSAVRGERHLGLYPAAGFRLADGRCADCPTIPQALWYFQHETIAVPAPGRAVCGCAPGIRAAADVAAWAATQADGAPLDYPPLVWVAAPSVADGARLAPDAATLTLADGRTLGFRPTPRLPLNRSYFDASSARYLAAGPLKVRGTVDAGAIVARTLWPEAFRLDPQAPPITLDPTLPRAEALRALVRSEPDGGARSPYAAFRLWQRAAAAPIAAGRALIGLLLNGAQGDDDEAHGGHFTLVTGRTRSDGAIGDWLACNFYSLDIESEKGILAAALPLDNYLADLNSGQSWYRPSYMVVAVLADDRAAILLQGALDRVYNQFYRHQLVYQHAAMNCAGVSIDVLRALGWDIRARGPTSLPLAAAAFPYFLAQTRSLAKARTACDYFACDQTRLLPAAAFEESVASLLALVGAAGAPDPPQSAPPGRLARMLAADVEAVAYLRFPQLPSSRACGNAPVATVREYRARLPANPSDAQIIPVPPRPFPDALRDPDLLPAPRRPADVVVALWVALVVGGLGWLAQRLLS